MMPVQVFRHHQLASRGDLLSQVSGHLSSSARCSASSGVGWGGWLGGLSFEDKKKHAFVNGQSTCVQTHLCCAAPGVAEVTPTPGLLSDLRTRQEQLCIGSLRYLRRRGLSGDATANHLSAFREFINRCVNYYSYFIHHRASDAYK